MSSSWGNTINLHDKPDIAFQKLMSMPDSLIPSYFTNCTRVPLKEIEYILTEMKSGAINPRDVKARLSYEIVAIMHGHEIAQEAQDNFKRLFQERQTPHIEEMTQVSVTSHNIVDVLLTSGIVKSKREARTLLAQNGVQINGQLITSGDFEVAPNAVLQKGKRSFFLIL